MVDTTNLDPRAAATVTPDKARSGVQEAATEILGILKNITTTQGDVEAIQLDLINEDGTTDTDYRGEAFGTQSLVLNDLFDIKQKIYMQTDASRLAELGSLSSRVFQKKYAIVARLMAEDLARGRVSKERYIEMQNAMINGGSAFDAILADYKEQKVAGKSRLQGFDNLVGIFNEVVTFHQQDGSGGAPIEFTDTIEHKFNSDVTAPGGDFSLSTTSRMQVYTSALEAPNSLIDQLQSKKISVAEFLDQQRLMVDTLLNSTRLKSVDSYITDHKSAIEALLSGTAFDGINLNPVGQSWIELKANIDQLVANLLNFAFNDVDPSLNLSKNANNTTFASGVNGVSLQQIAANFEYVEIDDGDDDYGLKTNIDTADRILNGIVFKSDTAGLSSMEKVMNYIFSLAAVTDPTLLSSAETKLKNLGQLSESQLALFIKPERFVEGGYLLSKDKQIEFNTVINDFAGDNIQEITGLSQGQYYYQTNTVGTVSFTYPAANGDKVVRYQGLNFAVPESVLNTIIGIGSKDYTECDATEIKALQDFAVEYNRAGIVEKQIQNNVAVVLEDNRTMTDVINGDKRLEGIDYSSLSQTEKLFAGTNGKVHSVEDITKAKLDLAENEYIPELAIDGSLQRNSGFELLRDINGFEVSEYGITYTTTAGVTTAIAANGRIIDPSTYSLDTNNKVVKKKKIDAEGNDIPFPLINSKGEVVRAEDLKRNSKGELVIPIQDSLGSKIQLLTDGGQPVFKLKVNTQEAKQNMVSNPVTQAKEVINSPILTKGKLVAPEFVDIISDLSGSYFMAGTRRVEVDFSTKEIISIDDLNVSDMDITALIRAGKEELALHYNADGKLVAPDEATISHEVLNFGEYQGLDRDVFYFGDSNNRKMAIMSERGPYIESFVSVDAKGRQQSWSPELVHVVRNTNGEAIPLIDPESKTALVQLQMKRSNQAKMLYAIEDFTASKQNSEIIGAKLPEPRSDGTLPNGPTAPPALSPTVSAMAIAKLGAELVQRAENLKEIKINPDAINSAQTSLKNTITKFNDKTSASYTEANQAFRDILMNLQQAAIDPLGDLSKKKADFANAKTALETAGGAIDTYKANMLSLFDLIGDPIDENKLGDNPIDTLKNIADTFNDNLVRNKTISEYITAITRSDNPMPVPEGISKVNFIAYLSTINDQTQLAVNTNARIRDVYNSTSGNLIMQALGGENQNIQINNLMDGNGDLTATAKNLNMLKANGGTVEEVDLKAFLNNLRVGQELGDIFDAVNINGRNFNQLTQDYENDLQGKGGRNKTTLRNNYLSAALALKDTVIKTFDSSTFDPSDPSTVGDSIEEKAMVILKEQSKDPNNKIGEALADIRTSIDNFSTEINAFTGSLEATFGGGTTKNNAEAKKLQELVLLTLIFSIFEESDWDAAQAETDTSRYAITDDEG